MRRTIKVAREMAVLSLLTIVAVGTAMLVGFMSVLFWLWFIGTAIF